VPRNVQEAPRLATFDRRPGRPNAYDVTATGGGNISDALPQSTSSSHVITAQAARRHHHQTSHRLTHAMSLFPRSARLPRISTRRRPEPDALECEQKSSKITQKRRGKVVHINALPMAKKRKIANRKQLQFALHNYSLSLFWSLFTPERRMLTYLRIPGQWGAASGPIRYVRGESPRRG